MTTIEGFRKAFEGDDLPGVVATFAEDIVLHSPAVIESEYPGRSLVATIMGLAMQTVDDKRVTDELHSPDGRTHALMVEGRVGAQSLQGCLYLRTNDNGLVDDLTFMIRPLHAVEAFVTAMGARGAQPALDLQAGGE
ncbi:MAG TPA: nuclear transport factor 2 family protein [Acidimicrobiia bacterium]|jgi:hypothetical protein